MSFYSIGSIFSEIFKKKKLPVEKPFRPKSIVVMVPVAHHIEPDCDASLRELEKLGVEVRRAYGYSEIAQGRSMMVNKALKDGFEWLMFIDADISFHISDVFKLVNHNYSVSGGMYSVKGWRALTSEFLYDGAYTFGPGGSCQEMKYMATGFMCVHRSVYEKLAETLPLVKFWGGQEEGHHFYLPLIIKENGIDYSLGEDHGFSHRVRKAGFKIIGDTTIKLAHIGRYGYSYDFLERGRVKEPDDIVYRQYKN